MTTVGNMGSYSTLKCLMRCSKASSLSSALIVRFSLLTLSPRRFITPIPPEVLLLLGIGEAIDDILRGLSIGVRRYLLSLEIGGPEPLSERNLLSRSNGLKDEVEEEELVGSFSLPKLDILNYTDTLLSFTSPFEL